MDRLNRAREMAARLSDAELAKELRNDRSGVHPEAWRALEEEARRRAKPKRPPILTTSPTLNQPIRRVLGVVGSEYLMGVNFVQELLAGVRDVVGGRSVTIQNTLREAREALLRELSARAVEIHADAVVSVAFTLSEWSGQNKSMLILMASGTAVELSSDAADV